jgi:tetratricopeptide (TPR) repeat protein
MRRKTLKFAIAGAIAFLIGFLSTIRSAPAQETRFDLKVREDFFAGFTGNQEALDRGMKACEATLAADPKNAEAMVWHGSGLYFAAGQAFRSGDQQKGMDLWTRGLKEMQTAVDLAPDSVGVRIPRGAVLLTGSRFAPPDMAKPLIEQGVSDYQRAFDMQKDHLATLGSHPRGELLFGLAEGYGRLGDEAKAREYFDLILKDLPGTAYAKRANAWMEAKSLPVEQTRCVGCHVASK